MTIRLMFVLILATLAGCSTTQLKALRGHIVGNAVGLVADVLSDDDSNSANAWVPAYQRCDSVCDSKRQLASARIAEENQRRLDRERKEKTEAAFDEFMDELQSADYTQASYTPVVFADESRQPF
ncbi:MAG: hypothetical protein WBN23_07010 [Woeseia sp.]